MTPLEVYVYFVIPFGGAAACLGFIGYAAHQKRAAKQAREKASVGRAGTLLSEQSFPRMAVDNTTSAA